MLRVTIKDVAHEAEVSMGSVSRVINGLPVSEVLRERVTQAISKLGYEPDGLAQSMRTRSTGLIGCLIPDSSNPLYAAIVRSLEQRLKSRGSMLMIASSMVPGRSEVGTIAEFKRRRVDGLIIAPGSETSTETMDALDHFGRPVVVLGRDFGARYNAVLVDHGGGTKAATSHLLGLGHRRIALATPLVELWPGRQRIAGFRSAYLAAGLAPSQGFVRPQSLTLDAATDLAEALDSPEPPTALIVLGTRILAGALQVVSQRRLSIPGDLSLLSIGDSEWVAYFNPPITTLSWQASEVSHALATLLEAQMDNGTGSPKQILIPTRLVCRQSCSPPHSAHH